MINTQNLTFNDLMLWTNKNTLEIALLCGKSEKTIKKYLRNDKPCKACKTLLIWLHHGMPQQTNWLGWKMRNDELISPDGLNFNEKKLQMLPILYEWLRIEEAKHKKQVNLKITQEIYSDTLQIL